MTRSILITGGSRGIGRACALHLARTEAAHLILLGRDAEALAATALALELIDRGITVNAVAPGWVDTAMAQTGLRQIAAATGQTETQTRTRAEAAVPVKRFFQPEEIAHGIAWLLDPANTMQVGQCLNLDGGVVQA